jgi:ACT domain-containing protein
MSDEQASQSIDLNTYSPTGWDSVVALPMSVPDRDFSPGQEVRWLASLTGSGVVVVNVVHEHYPEDMMQVQMVPRVDDNSALDTYCLHEASVKASIPDTEGDRIIDGIFQTVMQAVWGNPVA